MFLKPESQVLKLHTSAAHRPKARHFRIQCFQIRITNNVLRHKMPGFFEVCNFKKRKRRTCVVSFACAADLDNPG